MEKSKPIIYTKELRKAYGIKLTPWVRAEKKIGRNDKCPCGSGKKYKNCCINDYEQ